MCMNSLRTIKTLLIVVPIVLSLYIACDAGHDNTTYRCDDDTELPQDITESRIVTDTVVGRWELTTRIAPNRDTEWLRGTPVQDSIVYLTLTYDKNPILTSYSMGMRNLPPGNREYYLRWGGQLEWASDHAIYISFICLRPGTYEGKKVLLRITPKQFLDKLVVDLGDGTTGFLEIGEFLMLYMSERSVGSSVAELKPLIERYCTAELTTDLLNGEIVIEYKMMDLSNVCRTLTVHDTGLRCNDEETAIYYPFMVNWKPNPINSNEEDRIYLKVDSAGQLAGIHSWFRKLIRKQEPPIPDRYFH